jgi:hypothetical protein
MSLEKKIQFVIRSLKKKRESERAAIGGAT